ncbi:hypothetical protein [Actinokineospora enzanensis]|uniref:hypothetical protein n=1 Tax=Actinokineospora enzanensis TaxID=155975 RepID=UPI0012EB6986|nr:hypothetical protein [Actinokineospora enzanensis]
MADPGHGGGSEMGGKAIPWGVVFASRTREAFTVRIHGRYRVVLPNGIVRLPADQAEDLVRHECARTSSWETSAGYGSPGASGGPTVITRRV